tara:strand:+ start:4548 stop:5222 length:675 start_codon:yes stop_codon:yes gene_type:complete
MLNFNIMDNLPHWSEALHKISKGMPHKFQDYQESLNENHVAATSWMVEKLIPVVEEDYMKQGGLRVLILNSWLGLPIVPLLCEHLDIAEIHCVDLDKEALELSKLFHRHYAEKKFIKFNHSCLDVPFAFKQLNMIDVDIVISLNTEQMYPLAELTTKNPYALFALQNSNVIAEMYGINCVNTSTELVEQAGLTEVYATDSTKQTYFAWDGRKEYDRFLAIGSKN